MPDQLRIGVVGAGPWSLLVHAPMVANHPRTALAGVWARRIEAAEEVASPFGAPAFTSFPEFLDACDAVTFAVPPDVQAPLAMQAARAGKALLLEKPVALDLESAVALADVVEETGVATQMVLTWRYNDDVRRFLREVAEVVPIGARGVFLSGAFLGGMFATPWRLEQGPLLDLGPHVLDTLDAALGTIVGIEAHGNPTRWVGLLVEHESGVTSEVSLSAYTDVEPTRAGVEVYTRDGAIVVDTSEVLTDATMVRIVDEFVETAETGRPHPLDVHHGVRLQRLLSAAREDMDRPRRVVH
jgi:predicted dehydrogenase